VNPNPQKAELNYLKALDLMPANRAYYNGLSDFYRAGNDSLKLDSLMKRMALHVPDAYEPYYYYGLNSFRKGRYDEAAGHFEKAISLGCREEEMLRFMKDYYKLYNMQAKLDALNQLY
jgi:cytochrome c-type biogenesis protein CcmH/NrfG